jgi:beta-lactam-binding protein with PASTA domain
MVFARPVPVSVPDFSGKTLDQVRSESVVPSSRQQLFASISSEGPANGLVATQAPKPGTPVVPGSTRLFLTMAAPKPTAYQAFLHQLATPQTKTTRVPKLVGGTRDNASRDLEVAHLKASFTGEGGTVVQQYPPDGTEVLLGSLVTVTFGIPEVVVPSLYGMTLDEASDKLKENFLQTGKIEGENAPGSTVSSQYPPPGAQEPPGTDVALTMKPAQQPPPIEVPPIYVPNLEKMNLGDTDAALAKIGLRTGRVAGSKRGLVSDQQPRAGTIVQADADVNLTLSLPTVVVPDVMNDTEAAATSSLENFGLLPNVSRAKTWDPKAQHVVVKQDPSPGSTAEVGSPVFVTLGNLTPPPPAWKSVPGRVAAALPLAPWWFWLVTGLPLAAMGAAVIKTVLPPKAEPPRAHVPPAAQCTLKPAIATPKIRVGTHAGPKVKFTVALRNRENGARYRVGREPALRRKEVNRDDH